MKKKLLSIEVIMAIAIILCIGTMTFEGVFISKLPNLSWIFPRFIFISALLLGIVEIVTGLKESARTKVVKEKTEKNVMSENQKNLIVIMCLTVLFALGIWAVGFLISSFAFGMAYCFYSKYNKKVLFTIYMVVMIGALYILFNQFLGVSIPKGFITEYILNIF